MFADVGESFSDGTSPRVSDMEYDELLAAEIAFLKQNRDRLIRKYDSLFLLIKGAEVVDSFESETDAITEGVRKFGQEPFLVRRPQDRTQTFFNPALSLGLM